MCRAGDWTEGAGEVTVGGPCKANEVETVVDIVLLRNSIEQLNGGRLFRHIVWEDGGLLCEAEEEDEFGDPKSGTGVDRAGASHENVGVL